jgi:hypothetical protein
MTDWLTAEAMCSCATVIFASAHSSPSSRCARAGALEEVVEGLAAARRQQVRQRLPRDVAPQRAVQRRAREGDASVLVHQQRVEAVAVAQEASHEGGEVGGQVPRPALRGGAVDPLAHEDLRLRGVELQPRGQEGVRGVVGGAFVPGVEALLIHPPREEQERAPLLKDLEAEEPGVCLHEARARLEGLADLLLHPVVHGEDGDGDDHGALIEVARSMSETSSSGR